MEEENLKPLALRATQGWTFKVDESTPYDTRFEEEDARGDSRKTFLLHTSKAGKITYLVHASRKGLNDSILESITKSGLYHGDKKNIYMGAMDLRGLRKED